MSGHLEKCGKKSEKSVIFAQKCEKVRFLPKSAKNYKKYNFPKVQKTKFLTKK